MTRMSPQRACSIVTMFVTLIFVALASSACGPTGPDIKPTPLAAGVAYTGDWYSPQYENMTLDQKGKTVTGTFTYKEGGTLEGELDGNVLYFKWIQPGDMSKARREIVGMGYLVLSADGSTFEGEWGYQDEMMGGGKWTGERLGRKVEETFDPNEKIFDDSK